MSIDRSILSEFIKATNDNKEIKQTQLYGTVVTQGNSKCVKIDGSEIVTPVRSITDIKDDERVMVSIKDHMATVTGNMTNPSVGNDRVESAEGKIDRFDHLFAGNITAENIAAGSITTDKLLAGSITTDKLMAECITSDKISANSIESKHIKADVIESEHIKAGSIEAEHIKAGTIEADHISSGTITADKIATGTITAGSGIIADGAIGNAQISKIDAAKIEAGTIDTSKVTIQGSNGHLRLKGNRMQVFDGVGTQAKERVSVGDINGDGSIFGLRVRGADGQTILLDENGVKSEGITDGSITNDKISEDANIDGAKLNINSVVSKINEDGTETIQGTKIEVDGTTLNTKLSTITTKQTEDSERISQAQSQITANTNAIKLKVDEQTYTTDKKDMSSKLEKNTSEISTMKGQISLKVEQTDIENAKSELEGVMDSKINSAKAEIKVTTDAISQNVSNLSQTVSTKADGSTVSSLNSKVSSLETSVNGISGKVTSLEKTTTTLGTQVDTANTNASSALNKANSANTTANNAQNTANTNKNNITDLQGEVSTVKSNVASLEVTTSGISQKVSSVESTTATLSGKVNTANDNATNALNTANSANSKIEGLQVGGRNIFKNSGFTQGTSSWDSHSCNNLQIINEPLSISKKAINFVSTGGGIYQRNRVDGEITALPNGENYTVSGYVKCSSTAELRVALEGVTTKYVIPSSANAWVYFSHQFTGNGTAHTFTFYGVNGNVYTLKDLKLEKGNKPTDWTPAPEDVDGAINSVDSKVDTLRTEYNNTKSKVATIETNLSGITSRVSSAETNIEKISNASSQNLLYNSDFRIINGSLPDGWSVSDSSKITLDRNGTLLDGIPTFWFNVTGLTENAWKAVYSPFISAKAGEKFVASAYVIGHNNWSVLDAGGGLEIEYYNDSGRISTSGVSIDKSNLNWQRLVVKGIAPTGTTRARIRVHPVRNGQFNISKPMLQYGETVTGWDRGFDINNLTTRLKTAESKITEDAITNTVKKSFYTKSETDSQITSKGYQTASQVQQTVDNLQLKFTQSGGYNLLKNSAFANNSFDKWWTWGTVTRWTNLTYYKEEGDMYIANSSTTDAGGLWQTIETPILPNTEYTLSVLVHKEGNVKGGYFAMEYQETMGGSHFTSQIINLTFDNKRHSYTFTTPNDSRIKYAKCGFRHDGSNSDSGGFLIRINKPCLTTGSVNVWSPHPNEIYDGITTIDKDGITVTASNVKSKTNMSANGFKITKTDTNTDVFKVNSDGTLYMEGEISLTSSKGIKGKTTRKIVIANDNYCVYDGAETDVNRKVFMGFRPYNSNAQYIPSVMLGYNGINPNVDGAVTSGGTYTTYSHYPNNNNPESINLSYGALAFKYGAGGTQFSTINLYQNGDIDLKAGSGIYFRPSLRNKNNHVFGMTDTEVGCRVPFKCTSTIFTNGDITTDRNIHAYGNISASGSMSCGTILPSNISIGSNLSINSNGVYTTGHITGNMVKTDSYRFTNNHTAFGKNEYNNNMMNGCHWDWQYHNLVNVKVNPVSLSLPTIDEPTVQTISKTQSDTLSQIKFPDIKVLSTEESAPAIDISDVTNKEEITTNGDVDLIKLVYLLVKDVQTLKQENDELRKMIKEL